MVLKGILPFTRSIIEQVVRPGDTVVDATMGNGRDTLFLARLVGERGQVLAYDIQKEAVLKTTARLQGENCDQQVRLLHKGHETLEEELTLLQAPVSAAMFNLGYLPGGNKAIVTQPETTIQALHGLRPYLKKGGVITLVIYTGHDQGKKECTHLTRELATWDQQAFHVLKYQFINQKNDPPFLIAIQKLHQAE